MSKTITTLLLSLFLATAFAQTEADTTKVSFVAYWSVGDSYDFKVTKVKKNWKNKQETKKDSSQYIANFKVIDSTANSYIIEYTYTNTLVSSLHKKMNTTYGSKASLDSILDNHKIMSVIYTTDELGEFIGIENWQEISELMSGLFTQVQKTLKKQFPDKIKKLKGVMDPLVAIYSSKEGIEQLVLNELQYFHFPFGLVYDITKPIEYEQEFPNMVGGKPITGKATLTFESVDFENSFCVLKEDVVVNPDETKVVMKNLLKKMGFSKKAVKRVFKTAKLDIHDTNVYEYYYYQGVPHKISAQRKALIVIGDKITENETLLTIELMYEE